MTTPDLRAAIDEVLDALGTFQFADANERTEARRLSAKLRDALTNQAEAETAVRQAWAAHGRLPTEEESAQCDAAWAVYRANLKGAPTWPGGDYRCGWFGHAAFVESRAAAPSAVAAGDALATLVYQIESEMTLAADDASAFHGNALVVPVDAIREVLDATPHPAPAVAEPQPHSCRHPGFNPYEGDTCSQCAKPAVAAEAGQGEREAFEAWADGKWPWGWYRDAAWEGWQARATQPAPPSQGQWLPIETAPKDGSEILLTNGQVVHEGHWLHAEGGTVEHRDLDGRYIGQDDYDGHDGWIDWSGGMLPEPILWQPLPAAPTQPPAEGDA